MNDTWLKKYDATEWAGKGELWLDPEGNEVNHCDCSLRFSANEIAYDWSYDGDAKKGRIQLSEPESTWTDSFHQSNSVSCVNVENSRGLFKV